MRRTIETAPRDGKFVILEEDASGKYNVAYWSPEVGGWVGESGEPTEITPTYWHPIPGEDYLPQGLDPPFSRRPAAPQPATASAVISVPPAPVTAAAGGAQTPQVETKRALQARWRIAASAIAASGVAAAFMSMYFHAEVASYVTRHASHWDIPGVSPTGSPVVKQERQSSENEQGQEILAKELAEARRTVNELNLKLQTEAATAAQSLGQEHEKKVALVQDVDAARKALTAGVAQHRHALEEERAHSSALASELATTRRDVETKVALSSKAGDEVAQLRKAMETTTAELQQERARSSALASELATTRRNAETKVALSSNAGDEVMQLRKATETTTAELQQERARSIALASELATTRRDVETKMALSRKAGDEVTQLRKVAEATTAELQGSLQQERDKAAALARELDSARGVVEARMTPDRAANSQPKLITKPAAAEAPVTSEVQGTPEAVRLTTRARALLAQGNIGAARIVLERAVEMGSAEASFALAETYDPRILSSWGTYGTRGDASKARELYAKAMVGGIQEAKDRFNALRQ